MFMPSCYFYFYAVRVLFFFEHHKLPICIRHQLVSGINFLILYYEPLEIQSSLLWSCQFITVIVTTLTIRHSFAFPFDN